LLCHGGPVADPQIHITPVQSSTRDLENDTRYCLEAPTRAPDAEMNVPDIVETVRKLA